MFPRLLRFRTPDFLPSGFPEFINVYSYGVMIAIGIIVSFLIARKLTRKFDLDDDSLSSFFIWIIAASFIGGKFFFFLEDPERFFGNPGEMLRSSGAGFVFYGSLLFAVPTMIWWLRKKAVPVRPFLDEIAIIGPVIHSFGRVGCFLAGCCHGRVCHNILGVTFNHPLSKAVPLHTPLYPTQLFDIGINLIILTTVLLLRKKKKFQGQLFLIYIAMYAVGRSINEIYRGDEERGYVIEGILSHSQLIALILLGVTYVIWKKWKTKKNVLW